MSLCLGLLFEHAIKTTCGGGEGGGRRHGRPSPFQAPEHRVPLQAERKLIVWETTACSAVPQPRASVPIHTSGRVASATQALGCQVEERGKDEGTGCTRGGGAGSKCVQLRSSKGLQSIESFLDSGT